MPGLRRAAAARPSPGGWVYAQSGQCAVSAPVSYTHLGDTLYLLDQIKDDHDEIGKLSSLIALKESMKHLSDKEAQIINKRYYQGQTQTEIASELGISQAQVSRLEKSALQCLKKNF